MILARILLDFFHAVINVADLRAETDDRSVRGLGVALVVPDWSGHTHLPPSAHIYNCCLLLLAQVSYLFILAQVKSHLFILVQMSFTCQKFY